MLYFYVRQGGLVDKVQEKNSFTRNKQLQKDISFNTRKTNEQTNDYKKTPK